MSNGILHRIYSGISRARGSRAYLTPHAFRKVGPAAAFHAVLTGRSLRPRGAYNPSRGTPHIALRKRR